MRLPPWSELVDIVTVVRGCRSTILTHAAAVLDDMDIEMSETISDASCELRYAAQAVSLSPDSRLSFLLLSRAMLCNEPDITGDSDVGEAIYSDAIEAEMKMRIHELSQGDWKHHSRECHSYSNPCMC